MADGDRKNPYIIALSEKQQADLEKLKTILKERGVYSDPKDGKPATADDLLLVRFMKARRWAPQAAADQFLGTLEWRKQHDVDRLFREEVEPEEYESWKQLYPKFTGRRDNNGNPIYVYKLSVLTSAVLKELGKVPEEVRYRRIVALYELLHNLAFPLCLSVPITPPPPTTPLTTLPPLTPLPPHSVRLIQNTTLIDFSHTSLMSMLSFRHHLAQASTLAQANHPETLGAIFVVGAPGWWSTVWGWIRGWFDEQTRAKVHIVAAGSKELLDVIPRESLPRAYGGDMEWVFEDDPAWDVDTELLLRECGAPLDAGGKPMLKGPVIVTPRTPERLAKVELVGKGRFGAHVSAAPTGVAANGDAHPSEPEPVLTTEVKQPEPEAETPRTPGFVPALPGSVLGPAGTVEVEKVGKGEEEEEQLSNVGVVEVAD